MATTDVTGAFLREMAELERQLKESGKQLLHPPDSVDELLSVLDQVEKLLTKVDQSPKKSMQDALKPSMKALIQDNLSKHPDVDVKVAVASCISEITRITAPDAPYDDDQMRDVFRLIVSSFEDLADQSSRSYNKRASILETVSKVRSCVIMLDLECDELIVEMFEHFFKSVREYHHDSIFPSMENIMVLVLEESEEITVDMLKPILASVKRDSKGVPQVARKLGEGVLLKSAAKLKPYLMPALKSMGHSLDNYTQIVASVCEGTTATFQHDENATGPQPANESKLEKESVDEAHQGDDSKLTTASSDHKDQVVKEGAAPEDFDPTLDRSPKSVMSNGVNANVNEDASVDQESSKKPEEDVNQQNLGKEDTDDSDADKLAKTESKPEEETSKKKGKKAADAVINSSDSSHVEGEKEEAEKPPSETEKDNTNNNIDVKDPSVEAVIPSETDKVSDMQVSSPKATESEHEKVSSQSQSGSLPDESCVKNAAASSKKKQDEIASPSKSENPPSDEKTSLKKSGQPKNKALTQEDVPEVESDLDRKPQKGAGKKAQEVKPQDESENGEATSDSDAKPLKKSGSRSKKQSGKKLKQSGKKTVASEPAAKKLKQSAKKVDAKGEESDSDGIPASEPAAKKLKQSAKKVDAKGESDSDGKPASEPAAKKLKQSAKKVDAKGEESDSDGKPLMLSVKKGEKSKAIVEEEEESDSDEKPLKLSAKKSNSKKKDDGKKRATGKNVTEKDQAKSLSVDDEMDSSPKKSGKGEANSKETTPDTSAKRKRATGKDKVSDTIKYDESLVGTKVKVWWPEDKMYYEGVVAEFYPAKMKHRVSYVDGDEETLNLKKQKWEILQEFTVRDDEEQTAQSEGSPETHKKKRSKTDLASSASQQKTKDSVKRVGGVSSSAKAKGSALKDNKSKDNSGAKSTTQKAGGKSSDAASASKESGKSKEDEETPKAGSKTKTVNKSKGKTPQSGSKSNANGPTKAKSGSSNAKEAENVKTLESGKGKSTENTKTGSKKRKKRS